MHYYNEHNAYRAAVLRERIEEGLLPKGLVDERDDAIVPQCAAEAVRRFFGEHQ